MTPNREFVVLRENQELLVVNQTTFRPHEFYPCFLEYAEKTVLVYGEPIYRHNFESYFEMAQDRILRDFEKLGIIVNGKVISKTAFSKLIDVHNYVGRPRSTSFKVGYVTTHPKELLYAFMPTFINDTKANTIKIAYNHVLEIIEGNLDCVKDDLVQFGNCGIPVSMRPNSKLEKRFKNYEPFDLDS